MSHLPDLLEILPSTLGASGAIDMGSSVRGSTIPADDQKPYGAIVQWRTYTPNFRLYIFMQIMIKTVILKPRISDERDS